MLVNAQQTLVEVMVMVPMTKEPSTPHLTQALPQTLWGTISLILDH